METNTHSKHVQKHIEDLEYAFKNYAVGFNSIKKFCKIKGVVLLVFYCVVCPKQEI